MNWQKLTRVSAALLFTIIIAGFLWLILGMIGYNRLGWFGVWIAGFPPVVLGSVLFYVLNNLFKEIYG